MPQQVTGKYIWLMEDTSHSASRRFYEIDLLRFIAAMSVVMFHISFRGYAADRLSPLPFTDLGRFTRYGYLGVELFFMISGYVILLSVQGKSLRAFFVSRVTRLYPAFWVACTLTFIVGRLWGTGAADTQMSPMLQAGFRQYASNMTMLHELVSVAPVDGVYWSLTIEILFYFLISLLISYRLLRHVDVFIAILLVAAWLCPPGRSTFLSWLLFPEFAPYFAAGMLFYRIQQRGNRYASGYILLFASYALSLRAAWQAASEISTHYAAHFSLGVITGIISVFFIVFWLIISRRLDLSRASWLSVAGALTYPLYLLHSNISFIAFHRLGHLVNKYVLLAAALVVTLILSYLISMMLEKRINKALRDLLSRWLLRMDR